MSPHGWILPASPANTNLGRIAVLYRISWFPVFVIHNIGSRPGAAKRNVFNAGRVRSLFHEQKLWSASVPAMVEYLRNLTARELPIRLRLAHVLIDVEHRPRQALQVLDKISPTGLSEKDRQTWTALRTKAAKRRTAVPHEAPAEDW